jgi:hypothetical protein
MKRVWLLGLATLLSANAFAIELITEEQVQQQLGADKVIEISKYTALYKLTEQGTACNQLLWGRSSRAYIVAKGTETSLYVTPEGLAGLQSCGSL